MMKVKLLELFVPVGMLLLSFSLFISFCLSSWYGSISICVRTCISPGSSREVASLLLVRKENYRREVVCTKKCNILAVALGIAGGFLRVEKLARGHVSFNVIMSLVINMKIMF